MFLKNKDRKKSLVVLIATSFWAFYVVLTTYQYYVGADRTAELVINGRKAAMEYVMTSAVNTLVDDNVPLFESQMNQSRGLFLTDFYILQKDGKVLSFYNNSGSADSTNHSYKIYDQLIETELLAYKTVRVFDYALTVGIVTNKAQIVLGVVKRDIFIILKDIAMVTLFLSALLFLYLKDIINLSKVLSSNDRKKMNRIRSMSHEGRMLLVASKGFQGQQEHLKGENEHYSNTITPAILHEIKSGQSAPYSFESTMIRVDLNGYTQIFLEKREEYITEVMNKYFTLAREVIQRYDGLIYQFIGDEIVFHIKETKLDSQAMALACIRSLFEVAEQVERELPMGADHCFKIKCCLAKGKMRFINLDTGYGLSGLSLIETARLLTQVEDKSKNSVSFYLDAYKDFDFLCEVEGQKPTLFKGFQNQNVVAHTTSFKHVSCCITDQNFKNLTYFRSDNDLAIICRHFAEHLSIQAESDFYSASSFLTLLTLKSANSELISSFTQLLKSTMIKSHERFVSDKVLSTVIALTTHLIPQTQVTTEIVSLLKECLNHTDHRTCANAILVLGDFIKNPSFLREYIHSSNNRISADALFVAGKLDLDIELTTKIENYVHSKNTLLKASGLFVANELATHFKQSDPIFFETSENLQRIKRLVPSDYKRRAA